MDKQSIQSSEVLSKIERARQARRHKFYLRDDHVTLSHGSGGKATHNLIEGIFAPAFANTVLDRMEDSATITLGDQRLAFTTDSYVVNPLFFAGGDIGRLAVHGTINDLAMAGADPLYLSAGIILEEGFSIEHLQRIVDSMAQAAHEAGVWIVTGDTKVVQRNKADGIFINTAGVGSVRASASLGQTLVSPGDRVLLSGAIGDHGIAIMLAREGLEIEAEVESDSAALHTLVAALLDRIGPKLHCLKDPTRGGVATALNEVALSAEISIALDEQSIPIHEGVRGACEILGLDALTIANEGKLLAFVAPEAEQEALRALRAHPLGQEAMSIGTVRAEFPGMVFLRTDIGGTRVLDMLVGDPLPRIC